MSVHPGKHALDYAPYTIGRSRIQLRGPEPLLSEPFVAYLGGTETYGKFIARPFPELLCDRMSCAGLNLGFVNAGVDAYLHDPELIAAANRAKVVVFQITGAHTLNNRFYTVHPRRNDRFVKASALLQTVYREVDFTDITFTRHLLQTLLATGAERYDIVVEELRTAWIARMRTLLERIKSPVVLLWIGEMGPSEPIPVHRFPNRAPLLVESSMLDQLASLVSERVDVVPGPEAWINPTDGMVFDELERHAAQEMPGVAVHDAVADALAPVLAGFVGKT